MCGTRRQSVCDRLTKIPQRLTDGNVQNHSEVRKKILHVCVETFTIGPYYTEFSLNLSMNGWRAKRVSHRVPAMNTVNEDVGWEKRATGPMFRNAHNLLYSTHDTR